MEIKDNWQDSLIWCPSQCELRVSHKKKNYVIYLRWRWDDPWTASLIPVDEDWSDNSKWGDWIELDIPYFTDEQLEECKEAAIQAAQKVLDGKESKVV